MERRFRRPFALERVFDLYCGLVAGKGGAERRTPGRSRVFESSFNFRRLDRALCAAFALQIRFEMSNGRNFLNLLDKIKQTAIHSPICFFGGSIACALTN